MHAEFFKLGSVTIGWYGVFASLGLLAGYFIIRKRAKNYGWDIDEATDLVFFVMLAGFVGARVFYVINNWSYFSNNLWKIVKLNEGGLVFFGGFIGATLIAILYCHKKSQNIGSTADMLAPAVAMGHAFGRVGCLMYGCCFGAISNAKQAISFPKGSNPWYYQLRRGWIESDASQSLSLHPVQIYSSIGNLIICGILILISAKTRARKGLLFSIYLVLYSIHRFSVEFFRGDYSDSDRYFNSLRWTIAQVIAIPEFTIGIGLILYLTYKSKKIKNEKII